MRVTHHFAEGVTKENACGHFVLENIVCVGDNGCDACAHAARVINERHLTDFDTFDIGNRVIFTGRQNTKRESQFAGTFGESA